VDKVTVFKIGYKECHGVRYECQCGGEFAVREGEWEPKACPRCGCAVEKVSQPDERQATWEQIDAFDRQRRQDDLLGTRERLKAPKGMFRIVGVDTFEGPRADYLINDFESQEEAMKVAKRHGGVMNPVHVYDDQGTSLRRFGSV